MITSGHYSVVHIQHRTGEPARFFHQELLNRTRDVVGAPRHGEPEKSWPLVGQGLLLRRNTARPWIQSGGGRIGIWTCQTSAQVGERRGKMPCFFLNRAARLAMMVIHGLANGKSRGKNRIEFPTVAEFRSPCIGGGGTDYRPSGLRGKKIGRRVL